MLYRPATDHAGQVEDFVTEYQRLHPEKKFEILSLDSPEGANLAKVYGVTNSPAILAMADDGAFLQLWQDQHLPLFSDLDFYNSSR